jgi:hypothetical protein
VSEPRHWSCPKCARRTSSSSHVRERYCSKCEVWCDRADDGYRLGIDVFVFTVGEADAVKRVEQALREPGTRPMAQA